MLGLLESEKEMVMTYSLEQHLKDMGLILHKEPLPPISTNTKSYDYLKPNYFNDPRDPVTGEVPF